jgi:putative glutamine amidotransferase
MPQLASWIRDTDAEAFARLAAPHPEIAVRNARLEPVDLEEVSGLLVTGGPDISAPFHREPPRDVSLIQDPEPERDAWEFSALRRALERGVPVLCICKGFQVLNVALGGTLHLDIRGHNAPEMKNNDIQPLRTDAAARHRFQTVNSSHHQAIDRLAEGCVAEAWSADDGIIEQMRMADYPFALAVQYHPERGDGRYGPLFADFVAQLK